MDGQDLRSVLRLFAEVASSVDHDDGARAPDRHDPEQGGEDLFSGARSSTEGPKYRDKRAIDALELISSDGMSEAA